MFNILQNRESKKEFQNRVAKKIKGKFGIDIQVEFKLLKTKKEVKKCIEEHRNPKKEIEKCIQLENRYVKYNLIVLKETSINNKIISFVTYGRFKPIKTKTLDELETQLIDILGY